MLNIVKTCALAAVAVSFFVAAAAAQTATTPAGVQQAPAPAVTEAALPKADKGLCVVVGGGKRFPGLIAEMAAVSGRLVHGLALDEASRAAAQKAIDEQKLCGQATVERVALNPLPLLDNLVNVLVIEDWDAAAKAGLTKGEAFRVVSPEGNLCTAAGDKWTRQTKPRPAEMDDWRHPLHGPDGNNVSTDRALKFPIGARWADGLPVNIYHVAANRAWVIVKTRLFVLGLDEIENFENGVPKKAATDWLSCRDAFNGLPLWKIDTGLSDDGVNLGWQNYGPLAADENHVYTVQGQDVVVVDPATGKIIHRFKTKYTPYRLMALDGILVVTTWEARERPEYAQWVPKTGNGTLEAFDVAAGKPAWSIEALSLKSLAADGMVYANLQGQGADRPSEIAAFDLKSGKEKWRVAVKSLAEDGKAEIMTAGPGFVNVFKSKSRGLAFLAAADGKTLWEQKGNRGYAPLVNGKLADGASLLEPLTGKPVGDFSYGYLTTAACQTPSLTPLYNINWTNAREIGGGKPGKAYSYRGARSSCVEGSVPANGMLYCAQNHCRCLPAAMYGFQALGPGRGDPSTEDFARPRPVEQGPAFGKTPAVTASADAWPTYRHDAARSAAGGAIAATKLKEGWKVKVGDPKGPMAAAWEAQLTSPVTAPVVAGGLVVAADTDRGRIVALDAQSGKDKWAYTLPSRVDTPPTLDGGLCFIGCHDGWLYALRAADGQLAWRTRVAPDERRMVVCGKVESVWPAVGSVLVHDGLLYTTAGRSTESDGGIAVVACEAATGKTAWAGVFGADALRVNDVMALRGGLLQWRFIKLDPKTGKPQGPTTANAKGYGGGEGVFEGAIMDGMWVHGVNRRSGNAFEFDKIRANLMAWTDKTCMTPASAISTEQEKPLWVQGRSTIDPRSQKGIEAIALAGDKVVMAGHAKDRGFLRLMAWKDGEVLSEMPLDAVPTYDSIAVAGGKIYVSLQDGQVVQFVKAE